MNAETKAKLAGPFETLKAATNSYRDAYIVRITEYYLERLNNIRKTLADNGMDLNKVAPYPRSNIGRTAYQMAMALYHHYTAHFDTDQEKNSAVDTTARLSGTAPWIVKEKEGAEDKVRSDARRDAISTFDSYLYKLAGKIGKPIASATMTGSLWDGSILTVKCQDGEDQSWNTKCILNCSIYQKLFNQWPTRRTA